jgi:5'-methylthioadenosine phosphorylase
VERGVVGLSPPVGVFGGSGFSSFLDDVELREIETPFGPPSGPVAIGRIGDRAVVFLPRHGVAHEFAPHLVPGKANLWALRTLGVRQVIGPCAAGSLRAAIAPGDFVVLDQLVDRTWGRPDTYYDAGQPHHVSFADPYCPGLGPLAVAAAARLGITIHERGTVVVVQGPRFSTRAESRWYRSEGWDVVNMTQYPEAYLARELGLCYLGIALITDYDTGVEDDPSVTPVTQDQVFSFFDDNLQRLRSFLVELISTLPADPVCDCADSVGPLADDPDVNRTLERADDVVVASSRSDAVAASAAHVLTVLPAGVIPRADSTIWVGAFA